VILIGMVFDVDEWIGCSEVMEERKNILGEDVRANMLNLVTCVYLYHKVGR
jgi:hypothetical protein